ncbi:MAG: SDR family oxidoreductase [Bacteroidia bacterium]
MNLNLSNKTALVCGSTQGIGKAIAMGLAQINANVILCARNAEKLQQTLNELPNNGSQQHSYIIADFSDVESVKNAIHDLVINKQTTINILVNNTGGPAGGPIIDATATDFLNAYNAHLINNHNLTIACIAGMKASGYGRIINIISTSVKQPLKGLGVSNTTRAAVANWSKTMSLELAPFGITVNNVLPGATDTLRIKQINENKSTKTGKSVDELRQEMINEIPMARLANAEEVANAVVFLASPAASYISGINIPVDGGRTGCL